MATTTRALTDQQSADYQKEGCLIIGSVISSGEADDLRRKVEEYAPRMGYPSSLTYPEPGKYTISGNRIAEPGLAPIAEHPVVVDAVEALLGQPAYLTAYVAYLRSPGDKGGGAHCDYKRWRPVGSSMNWLFAIIPLTDFNAEYGPLLVSPGSHQLSEWDTTGPIWDVTRPDEERLLDFVDPELKAGDLLLMHGHTWHKAPGGTTDKDRCGIFNKYCAVNAPPAAGYYPYDPAALDALGDSGKRLLKVCFDKPIASTSLLIEDSAGDRSRFLVLSDAENGRVELPGGEGWEEEEGVGWDVGARIGSLQALTQQQIGIEVPWMSYIEDVEQDDGICRVYGYSPEESLAELLVENGNRVEWLTPAQLQKTVGEESDIYRAAVTWQRDDTVRGKGKAVSQRTEQYA